MGFLRRKKKEVKEETEIERKPVPKQESSLDRICKKYERSDLAEPLSWTLLIDPRGRDLESLLSSESPFDYSMAGCVMLYEGNSKLAKEYFEKAIEMGITRKEHYRKLVDNIDVVTKIGMDWWEAEGKYMELEKK
jgi:hypothetical protein